MAAPLQKQGRSRTFQFFFKKKQNDIDVYDTLAIARLYGLVFCLFFVCVVL